MRKDISPSVSKRLGKANWPFEILWFSILRFIDHVFSVIRLIFKWIKRSVINIGCSKLSVRCSTFNLFTVSSTWSFIRGFQVQRLQLSETAYYIDRDLAYPTSPIGWICIIDIWRLNPFDGSWLVAYQPGTLNPEPLNLGIHTFGASGLKNGQSEKRGMDSYQKKII